MTRFRDSLSKKLTAMNLLVSGGALLLASAAFFAYDLVTFRTNMATNTSIQAQIIGSNAVSPLTFNDSRSAEITLAALRASQHIVYAGIYTPDGHFFAGYWRDGQSQPVPLPPTKLQENELFSFKENRFNLIRPIAFKDHLVGIVYIESDLGAINDRLKSYAFILVSILTVSLIAALMLSRLFQRSISEPILRLAETARLVSREKNYFVRAPTTGDRDEVALLANAFNEMLVEIQKRESALQESERQFRTLADSIPQLAWMAEADGKFIWYNHRWYEYTGTSVEEMVGLGWESVHDPKVLAQVRERWKTSINTGQPFEMIFPLRGADGSFRDFLTRAMPVSDNDGKVMRWFGTNTDVTEQRRAEEALRQSEKLAATGRLAASIAHEINNPLEAVTNLVYLSLRQPSNVQMYLKLADQELDRIAEITKNTLGFYRDSATATEVNISEVLREVAALYARKLQSKGITLQPDYGDRVTVFGYPGELRQVFANLVANAIDALAPGGCLTIRVSETCSRNGLRRPGVRITFLDNGAGITPAHRRRIFEPFYTTKNTGTGLGLWLCQGLVDKHFGSLRVRSSIKPGRTWTAFTVFLPRQPPTN